MHDCPTWAWVPMDKISNDFFSRILSSLTDLYGVRGT